MNSLNESSNEMLEPELVKALDRSVDVALSLELSEYDLINCLIQRMHLKEDEREAFSREQPRKMYDGIAGP